MCDTANGNIALGSMVGSIGDDAYRAQDGPDNLTNQDWTFAVLKEQHYRYNGQHDAQMHAPPAREAQDDGTPVKCKRSKESQPAYHTCFVLPGSLQTTFPKG